MKTSQAILLPIGITLLCSIITFDLGGTKVHLMWSVILLTAIWAAIDSSKLQLRRYKSGISYSPVVVFLLFLLLWIVAFPWYLSMRYKIRTGTALLKGGAPDVAAA